MEHAVSHKFDLSANFLKYLAIAAMFLDHFASVFIPSDQPIWFVMRVFGRLCAPIMCYFVAEGEFFTSNRKKYLQRLVLFALLAHFPYVIYFNLPLFDATSVLWGLALGLMALIFVKHSAANLGIKIAFVGLCCLLAIWADWNFVSVLWILGFGLFRGNFKKQMLSFLLIGIVFHLYPLLRDYGTADLYQIGIVLAIPVLALYHGRKGRGGKWMKWGFYLFYPGHLLLLELLKILIR
ncbi:TraX family protein [Enterococcus sp. AZ072]|uniref:TraX family protein n=1 Tax=unclassified Enterococcus TaxID=2608891 RepID=UPI003D2CB265